ncbi:MAG: BamA/TamA family outer membrane protein [Gemmatimonadetes bacterium]|nr:BamA/TamA family outer membrane protein [Gemmatimonadota bacterium]
MPPDPLPELRVLHASDLQIGRPFLRTAGEAFLALIRELAPDLVVVSGDLTQRAKKREYEIAEALLTEIGAPAICVAGNHDVALYRFWERLLWPWRKWDRHIGERRSACHLPGRALVVGLNTASPHRGIVNGRLRSEDLNYARTAFDGAEPGERRILVIHHCLRRIHGKASSPLPNAEDAIERIAGMGVDVVLAGHQHVSHADRVVSRSGSFLLIHAGTATSSRWRAPEEGVNTVNLLDLNGPALAVTRFSRSEGKRSFLAGKARRLLFGLLAAVALAGGGGAAAQIPTPQIHRVEFTGDLTFPVDSLRRIVQTRSSECVTFLLTPFCWAGADFATNTALLRERSLVVDAARLRAWYHQRGFQEASVGFSTVEREDGSVDVTFTIDEGRPVLLASFEIAGLPDSLSDAVPAGGAPVPGKALSIVDLQILRDSLEARLADRGYAHARVLRQTFVPAGAPYAAEVTLDVSLGPLVRYGEITVTGNSSLDRTTILYTARIAAGDLYSREELRNARTRLFGLEIVRRADLLADSTAILLADSVMPLEIRISESDAYRFRYGAGLNSAECLDAETRWTARNFLGAGRRLSVRTRVSNVLASQLHNLACPQSGEEEFAALNWLASLEFSQPWVFSTRNSFSATFFAERNSVPDIFVREAIGASAAVTRPLNTQTTVTAAYGLELSSLSAADALLCASLLVCDPNDISILADRHRLAPVTVRLNRSLVTGILNPTAGYVVRLDYEYASSWTGSDFTYQRVLGEGVWYSQPASRLVLATRLRGGWVGADGKSVREGGLSLHPTKRFYSGGASSVRGFEQGGLGPRVLYVPEAAGLLGPGGCDPEELAALTCDPDRADASVFLARPTGGDWVFEANLETRIGLSNLFEGVLFADVGQVWNNPAGVSLSEVEVAPGLGVRYASPIGPLRLDLGYHFRAGEELPVVVPLILPYLDGEDPESRLVVDGRPVPWVQSSTLARLKAERGWGEAPGLSVDRLRLHVSIGQAF